MRTESSQANDGSENKYQQENADSGLDGAAALWSTSISRCWDQFVRLAVNRRSSAVGIVLETVHGFLRVLVLLEHKKQMITAQEKKVNS